MTLSNQVRERLLRLIGMGLDSGVGRLAQLSGASWKVGELSLREGETEGLRQAGAAGGPGHCGTFFQMPGGVFLISFPQPSADAVVKAYAGGFSRKADGWKGQEPDAMAEISNIVINPVVNFLGDASVMSIFLSSPQVERGDWDELDAKAFDRLVLREDPSVVRADARLQSEELSSDCRVMMLFNSKLAGLLAEALGD